MPFDAHIHLDQYKPAERTVMLDAAFRSGVEGVLSVSMDRASCEENLRLARTYPGRVIPAYGHHPEQPPLEGAALDSLCRWIAERPRHETFAIGEVGLPYFLRKEAEAAGRPFDTAPYMTQFERFVRLAAELDRPLALHAVYEDTDTVMDLLQKYRIRRAHFHWFKGSPQTVERLIDNRYMISVTPEVLYDEETRHLARTYPLDLLMVETDGPWPFEGPFTGKLTEPSMVIDSVREIALLRSLDVDTVRNIAATNTQEFYGFLEQGGRLQE
ncbi:TatD family deoxyribonuclease [Cohnella pontilimi]|uniref:TatD family deoxyribonuclease n=1 Tax=Cohnella pontilimi TaxID=2564100 RepID=A0A4U0FE67_9BACL|nr:TatD family hydrolase [Cohnella pontilimi]TJY43236.1 TatD family deoxyribonuclease [Cohnella pontilimi]